jgi:hypothetical protein
MRLAGVPARIASLAQGDRPARAGRSPRSSAPRSRPASPRATRSTRPRPPSPSPEDQERRLRDESQSGSVPKVEAQRAATEAQKTAAVRDGLNAESAAHGVRRADPHQPEPGAGRDAQPLGGRTRGRDGHRPRHHRPPRSRHRQAPDPGPHRRARSATWSRCARARSWRRARNWPASCRAARSSSSATSIRRPCSAASAPGSSAGCAWTATPGRSTARSRRGSPAWVPTFATTWSVSSSTPEPASAARIVLQHGLPGSIEVSVDQTVPALLVLRTAGQWFSGPARAAPATPTVSGASAASGTNERVR